MYQKEIIYMGLHRNGSRLGSAGFLKVENKDAQSRLFLKLQNVPQAVNGRFPVRIYSGEDWKEMDGVIVKDGSGVWEECINGVAEKVRIQIFLPEGYLIEGQSRKAEQRERISHDQAEEQRDRMSYGQAEEQRGRMSHGQAEEQRGRMSHDQAEERRGRMSYDQVTEERERISHGQAEEQRGRMSYDQAEEQKGRMSYDQVTEEKERISHGQEEERRERMSHGQAEERGERISHGQAEERRERMSYNQAEERRERISHNQAAEQGERISYNQVAEQRERLSYDQIEEQKRNMRQVRIEGMNTEANSEQIPDRNYVLQPQQIIDRKPQALQSSIVPKTPNQILHEDTEMGMPQPCNVKEDKWEQILSSYEQIHPYGDERVYVKLEPKDFIILQSKYQHLVNNSFLLHGFYNYRYVILGKEGDYYLGVPGVFYKREKMVALMFGFEAFECEDGVAEEGKFGYYLRKVEL